MLGRLNLDVHEQAPKIPYKWAFLALRVLETSSTITDPAKTGIYISQCASVDLKYTLGHNFFKALDWNLKHKATFGIVSTTSNILGILKTGHDVEHNYVS